MNMVLGDCQRCGTPLQYNPRAFPYCPHCDRKCGLWSCERCRKVLKS